MKIHKPRHYHTFLSLKKQKHFFYRYRFFSSSQLIKGVIYLCQLWLHGVRIIGEPLRAQRAYYKEIMKTNDNYRGTLKEFK